MQSAQPRATPQDILALVRLGARVHALSLCEIQGLGHAWSGGAASQAFSDPQGPDASRMVWAFVAKQFATAGL